MFVNRHKSRNFVGGRREVFQRGLATELVKPYVTPELHGILAFKRLLCIIALF